MKLKSLLFLTIIFLLWPISAYASLHISFEFVNLESSQQEESFPVGVRNEIIVASDDVDIRTLLPIQLKIQFDTKSLEMTIPKNPQQFCRGSTGCSREGPVISQSEGGFIEITAIDKDGNNIAHYQTGTLPEAPSPSPTPALSPSPTPPPPAVSVSEVEREQVPEVKQPLLSNRNLGILLILIALALIASATTGGGWCPNLCTEGNCQNCELTAIRIAVHGTEPGEIEEMLEDLDVLKWFRWIPGATPGGKELIPEIVEKAKKIGQKLKKLGMKINGADVYATISWEECKRVSCWLIWTRTTWVKAQKEVKIPPGIYRYLDINPDAWRPDRLIDEKKRKEVHRYIERVALKNCPEKCRSI